MIRFDDPLRLGLDAGVAGAVLGYGLTLGGVEREGLEFRIRRAPQGELDALALDGQLDATMLSPAAWACAPEEFALLDFGMRRQRLGPWLFTAKPRTAASLAGATVAVGGEHLSALVAARAVLPDAAWEVVPEPEILGRILDGEFDAGLIGQGPLPRDQADALHCVADLSFAWSTRYPGPGWPRGVLPISVLAVRRALGGEPSRRAARVMRRCVAVAARMPALDYALRLFSSADSDGVILCHADQTTGWGDAATEAENRILIQEFLSAAGLGAAPAWLE